MRLLANTNSRQLFVTTGKTSSIGRLHNEFVLSAPKLSTVTPPKLDLKTGYDSINKVRKMRILWESPGVDMYGAIFQKVNR